MFRTSTLSIHLIKSAVILALVLNASTPFAAPNLPALTTTQTGQFALLTQDQIALRAAPRDSAPQQAALTQGELLEVRGSKLDYLQVYDYRRERGGFIKASQVRLTQLSAAEAPDFLAVLRFVRDTPGQEMLGIGYALAYLKAAPTSSLQGEVGLEVLDTLGRLAERLADRSTQRAASTSAGTATSLAMSKSTALNAQLETASAYGVRFQSYERNGQMQICYDGEAFQRVLSYAQSLKSNANSVNAEVARYQVQAALGLSKSECQDPTLSTSQRIAVLEAQLQQLNQLSSAEENALPAYWRNRLFMRRAGVAASLSFQLARTQNITNTANPKVTTLAQQSVHDLTRINQSEVAESDLSNYNDAIMRGNAMRWAAEPVSGKSAQSLQLQTRPGQAGETCLSLVDTQSAAKVALLERCTYGLVWANSFTINREKTAATLAVQPLEAWREIWVFRKTATGWIVQTLPPSLSNPELGYVEFAGWVPGGNQMLMAREVRSEGKYKRNYELMNLDSLTIERQANDSEILGPFQRWADPSWKRQTLSLR